VKIHTIDLRHEDRPGVIAAFLVQGETGLALIETGPESALPALLDGLRALGVSPDDIKHVLVTHIHLDHAGAAGWWAKRGARVFVHERGAAHLINPSRLLASAGMVYGDRLKTLWGSMTPAPEANVKAICGDEAYIHIGDLAITALNTPGHARHHLTFQIGGDLFAGDVCGARLPGCDYISLTSAPPQFDPSEYDQSLNRLSQRGIQRIHLTHFGIIDDPADHIARYRDAIRHASDFVQPMIEQGETPEAIRAAYEAKCRNDSLAAGCSGSDWEQYEAANPAAMCADGIAHYWKRGL
jgi:glyoxylase-like metal-dependent hydrolase (beta-lactamase superfamily II)